MNIAMTPAAEKFIRRMIRFGTLNGGFRLAVKPGGCSGLAADFDVEPAPRPGDAVVEVNGLKLFLPAQSRLLLDGVVIDFAESTGQSGFLFHDPKAPASSCSTSASMVTLQSLLRPH